MISFRRAETNHDKVASPETTVSPMRCQFTLHIICINFQVVFFADNFRECATLNTCHEEILKLHFLLNQGGSIFSEKLIYKGRCDILFCYLVWFPTRLVRVMQHAVRHCYRQCRLFFGLVRTSITPHNSPCN